ncbi:MAG: FecR domain-containing protein, partial [Pirellulaceae bacterium]|nr:FecR domain-containing protein [Pirellulaceae bacterium]
VTGIAGAKWSDEPNYIAPMGVGVALGRTYKLKTGLMEITYDSGAKVILEGPCDYEVESSHSGYLALGKLVARVGVGGEGRGAGEVASGQWPVASMKEESGRMKDEGGRPNADSLATRHQSLATNPSPLSPLPSPLFTVRTPTAVVTDLGTEFSVEVGTNGDIFSHVYRGTVRVELVGQPDGGVMLREQESVQVSSAAKRLVKVDFSPADADKFFRLMPVRERIEVFNTGYGLAEGEADPHWQVVAASNDPDFKPRLAMVTIVNRPSQFRPNDPARSQWISTVPDLSDVPNGVTYTFRTTFELTDLVPGSAKLRIGFLADNRVQAVRLNGAPVAVPEHGHLAPFYVLNRMIIEEGFVAGANVLEIDVFNGAPESGSSPASPMALLVELEGTMLRGGRAAAVNAPDDKPRANEGRGVNDERSLNHQNYSYFGNRLSCLCLKRG